MSEIPSHVRSVKLALPPEEAWELHHVLLNRIEQEAASDDPTSVEPPSIEVFQAFDTLDTGEARFTFSQLDAIQSVLTEYQESATLENVERSRLAQLQTRISNLLDQNEMILSTD